MGCGSSMDTSSVHEDYRQPAGGPNTLMAWQKLNGVPPQSSTDVVAEFIRLDEHISKLESNSAGPRLATAEAWTEHLQGKLNSLIGVEGMEHAFATQQQQQQLRQQQQAEQYRLDEQTDLAIGHADILRLDDYEPAIGGVAVSGAGGSGLPAYGSGLANGGVMANGRYAQLNGHAHQQPPSYGSNSRQNGNSNAITTNMLHSKSIVANTPNQDLANLALNLGVVGDVQKASTHEDFFAQLSDSALHLMSIRYFTELLEHNRVRLKKLAESYAELNELYVNSDGIIAFISGGTYMSRLEENLDGQLETARDIRDKLGSALEQWRICGTLLHTCATAATQALQLWRQLAKTIQPKDKMQLALSCRTSLQASLISLECAQMALPHVELQHVSNRQVLAVQHCNRYIVTDIANLSRYEHTSKVFAAYESNMAKTSTWLYDTYKSTLRKDYEKADETVRDLAKSLRDHRQDIFGEAQRR